MEVVVAGVIAIIAALGLAYSFSVGRVQIDRFEVARAALAIAQQRMDSLSVLPASASAFSIGMHPDPPIPFNFEGSALGTEIWEVQWVNDPATKSYNDLKRVSVSVVWTQGTATDSVRLSRLFLPK